MKTKHLSEQQVQEYALNMEGCESLITQHIHQCADCRNKAALYKAAFSNIASIQTPAFGFNLSLLVLSKIERSEKRPLLPLWLLGTILIFAASFLFIFFLIMYYSAYAGELFSARTRYLSFSLIIAALLITAVQVKEYINKYSKQAKILQFPE